MRESIYNMQSEDLLCYPYWKAASLFSSTEGLSQAKNDQDARMQKTVAKEIVSDAIVAAQGDAKMFCVLYHRE